MRKCVALLDPSAFTIPYDDHSIEELVLPPRQEATYVRPPLREQNFVTDHYGGE